VIDSAIPSVHFRVRINAAWFDTLGRRVFDIDGPPNYRTLAGSIDSITGLTRRPTIHLKGSQSKYWTLGALIVLMGFGLLSSSDATARVLFSLALALVLIALAGSMFLFLIVGIGIAVRYPIIWVNRWRLHRLRRKRPDWNSDVEVTLAPHGASLEPGTVTPWGKIKRINIFSDGVLLDLEPNLFSWLPFDALVTGSPQDVTNMLLGVAPDKVMRAP
jgi:hypothetical protein